MLGSRRTVDNDLELSAHVTARTKGRHLTGSKPKRTALLLHAMSTSREKTQQGALLFSIQKAFLAIKVAPKRHSSPTGVHRFT